MTPLVTIALVLMIALITFLMYAYIKRDTSSANQHKILRLLSALCGGFAGSLFTGEALLRYEQQLSSGAKLGFSATLGCALFGLIWITFGKWQPPSSQPPPPPPNRIKVSIPEGWTFEQAARLVVEKVAGGVLDIQELSAEQRGAKMRAMDLEGSDGTEVLTKLQYGAADKLLKYRIEVEGDVFHIRSMEASNASC